MSASDDAFRPEPSQPSDPRFDSARLEAWFNGGIDVELVGHAYDLVEARFVAAGLKPDLPDPGMRRLTQRWHEFCWYLFHALYGQIYRESRDALATDVFADLVALCLQSGLAPPGSEARAYRFAHMLSIFQERDTCDERLIALLPPEMQAELPGIRAVFAAWKVQADEWEEELFRMGQHGY